MSIICINILSVHLFSTKLYLCCTMLIFILYKCSLNLSPEYIAHLYLRNNIIHEHSTRGCHELTVLHGAKTFSNISARI